MQKVYHPISESTGTRLGWIRTILSDTSLPVFTKYSQQYKPIKADTEECPPFHLRWSVQYSIFT